MNTTNSSHRSVLDAQEWHEWLHGGRKSGGLPAEIEALKTEGGMTDSEIANSFAKEIARANAALPDDDPRKITWEMVDELRFASERNEREGDVDLAGSLNRIADILARYLPPRGV